LSVELDGPVSNSGVLLVIVVERINAKFANTIGAVRAGISLVTVAAHGRILVPQVVNVVGVLSSNLFNCLAGAVAGASEAASDGAVRSLARRSVVALEALAVTSPAVADALVGALTVLVGRVIYNNVVRINHVRVLLRGAFGVHCIVDDYGLQGSRSSELARRRIEITLGRVNVCKAKLADSLGAVVRHPVPEADALVIGAALTVGTAGIGALGINIREESQNQHY